MDLSPCQLVNNMGTCITAICYTENDGFAYLGENWNYSNAVCSCTADINVNNNAYNPNMSLWNTPILCGQTGGENCNFLD